MRTYSLIGSGSPASGSASGGWRWPSVRSSARRISGSISKPWLRPRSAGTRPARAERAAGARAAEEHQIRPSIELARHLRSQDLVRLRSEELPAHALVEAARLVAHERAQHH